MEEELNRAIHPDALLPRTSIFDRLLRCARLALHLTSGVLSVLLVFPALASEDRLSIRQRWSAALLRILSLDIDSGEAEIAPGSLVLANHVSWLDVFVLNALYPQAFGVCQ